MVLRAASSVETTIHAYSTMHAAGFATELRALISARLQWFGTSCCSSGDLPECMSADSPADWCSEASKKKGAFPWDDISRNPVDESDTRDGK